MADPREIRVRVLFEADQASAQQAAQQVRQVGQQAGEAFNQGVKPAQELADKVNNAGNAANDAAMKFKFLGETINISHLLAVIAVYSVVHSAISGIKTIVHEAWNQWMSMEKAMGLVRVATGATGEELVRIRNHIEFYAAAAEAGYASSEDLANGLAMIERHGIRGAEALTLVKQAGLAAWAGFTDIKSVLEAVLPVLHLYGNEFKDVTEVTDLFLKAQRLGGPDFEANSSRLGEMALSAYGLGVSVEDVMKTLTALNRVTGSSNEAFSLLDQIMRRLREPTAELEAATKRYNGQSVQQLLATEGLTGFFRMLNQETQGNVGRMVDLIGSLRGSTGAILAKGDAMKTLIGLMQEWDKAGSAAGETERQLAARMQTDAGQIDALVKSLKEVAQTLGGLVAPAIVEQIKGWQEYGKVLGEAFAWAERWQQRGGDMLGPRTREMLQPGSDEVFSPEFRARMSERTRGAADGPAAPKAAPKSAADAAKELSTLRDHQDQVIKSMMEQLDLMQRIDSITGKGDTVAMYKQIHDAVTLINQELAKEKLLIEDTTTGPKAKEDALKRTNALQKEKNELMFREAQIAKDLATEYKQAGDQFKRAMEAFAAVQIREIMLPVEIQGGLRSLRGELIRGGMTRAEEADPNRVRRIFQEQRQLQSEQHEAEMDANRRALLTAVTQTQITDLLRKKNDLLLQNARSQMELNRQEEESIRNANIRATQEEVARLQRRQEMMSQLGIYEGTVTGSDLTPSQLEQQKAEFRAEAAQMTRQQLQSELGFMHKYSAIAEKTGTYEQRLAFQQRRQAFGEALNQPDNLAERQQDIFDQTQAKVAEVSDLIGKSMEKQAELARQTAAGAYSTMLDAYQRVVAASPEMGALAAQAWLRAFRDQMGNLPAFVREGFFGGAGGNPPIPVRPGGNEGGTTININGIKVDLSENTKEELKAAAVRAALSGAGDVAAQNETRLIGGKPGGAIR